MDVQSILLAVNTLIIAPIYFILMGIRADVHQIQNEQRHNGERIAKLEAQMRFKTT